MQDADDFTALLGYENAGSIYIWMDISKAKKSS